MSKSKRASAPIVTFPIYPVRGLTPVVCRFIPYPGIVYIFEEREEAIRQSGLVLSGVPYPSMWKGSCIERCEPYSVRLSRLGDGRLRLTVEAEGVIAIDSDFRCFLGGLLADSRLSLVKGESA